MQSKAQIEEKSKQEVFDRQLDKVIDQVEAELRKAKYMTLDSKGEKAIRDGKVSYEIFDEENYLSKSKEKPKPYKRNCDNLEGSDEEDEDELEKLGDFQFTDLPLINSHDSTMRPVLVGEDAENLHQDELYIVRRPIKAGVFALRPYLPPVKSKKDEDEQMTDQDEDEEIEREELLALDEFYS